MSSRMSEPISPRLWHVTLISLAAVSVLTLLAALLIVTYDRVGGPTWTTTHFDERWTIHSGTRAADHVVLRSTTSSTGSALHPIESDAFALQTRLTFDDAAGTAGLIVQAADAEHFSAFLISSDGYFSFSDFRNGVWIDRVAWRAWPHIRRDGTANVLRAECAAQRCTFFVNDEWTWQAEDVPVTRLLGFVAQSSETGAAFEARFDQLGVRP
jgi:hypothetical protein